MSTLLGIDLGTSAIKLLVRRSDGHVEKAREGYATPGISGWLKALETAAARLDLTDVDAIGLSSQVGTYIVNGSEVMGWSSAAGLNELRNLKSTFDRSTFIREISMDHPDMVSYPIPRLMHIMAARPDVRSICMPKELLIKYLTGAYVSDMYSWRGLANQETGSYSRFFLDHAGASETLLPPLIKPTDVAGYLTSAAAKALGMREGTPVYTGCNDFFAGLLGAGVLSEGAVFDVTGTSEHMGGIAGNLHDAPGLISGRYFSGFVRYGVTGSSGDSLNYARRLHGGAVDPAACLRRTPPLFLPYLSGERCPVCDPMARGVMFGINSACDSEMMAYSIMEGVCFNIRQIYESLDMRPSYVSTCGGAALNPTLNQMKADILGISIVSLAEPDTSALGAALIAGAGCGEFSCLADIPAPEKLNEYIPNTDFDYTDRYRLFRQLYPALKEQFTDFGRFENK